jgi:hypothetical protein
MRKSTRDGCFVKSYPAQMTLEVTEFTAPTDAWSFPQS